MVEQIRISFTVVSSRVNKKGLVPIRCRIYKNYKPKKTHGNCHGS